MILLPSSNDNSVERFPITEILSPNPFFFVISPATLAIGSNAWWMQSKHFRIQNNTLSLIHAKNQLATSQAVAPYAPLLTAIMARSPVPVPISNT